MVQLVNEKRELYRDKLQLLLQTVTTVPTDSIQQDVEEDGDSPCCDDTPCDDVDEQIEQYLYDDDGKLNDHCIRKFGTCNFEQSYNQVSNEILSNHDIPYKMKIWYRMYFGGLTNYKNLPN